METEGEGNRDHFFKNSARRSLANDFFENKSIVWRSGIE